MKWDIFGRKKQNELERKINTILNNISDNNKYLELLGSIIEKLEKKINVINKGQSDLSGKFDRLINELKRLQETTKIPVVKPFIRDPEKTYNEERKKDEENYAHNLWRI